MMMLLHRSYLQGYKFQSEREQAGEWGNWLQIYVALSAAYSGENSLCIQCWDCKLKYSETFFSRSFVSHVNGLVLYYLDKFSSRSGWVSWLLYRTMSPLISGKQTHVLIETEKTEMLVDVFHIVKIPCLHSGQSFSLLKLVSSVHSSILILTRGFHISPWENWNWLMTYFTEDLIRYYDNILCYELKWHFLTTIIYSQGRRITLVQCMEFQLHY